MEETQNVLPMFEEVVDPVRNDAANERWMRELGEVSESLAYMMRKPTIHRPFVYEVRFDLLPVKGRDPMAVLKGFGAEGSLCAFVNGTGFLNMLRGAEGGMKSGKLRWYQDTYPPSNYEGRQARFSSGDIYNR